MESIEMLINELESEFLKAKKAAFSQNDIVLDKKRMLDLVSKFRNAYPTALKEANDILKQKDDMLKQAEDYANATMDKAEEHAEALIQDTEVVKKANEYAEQIRYQAQEMYVKTDYEARQSAYSLLENLEKSLNDTLDVINANKQKLIK